jgi:hypothetical protein
MFCALKLTLLPTGENSGILDLIRLRHRLRRDKLGLNWVCFGFVFSKPKIVFPS